jgi:hypothetical protein
MKVDKAINFLAAIGSILAGVGEVLKQFNCYQKSNNLPTEENRSMNSKD